ncbi:LacI family transcriptional regulator [Streptomycetaceae bacterium NBC_01309]
MAITSRDVARMAGVSQPTVSRVLRGVPGVAPETRERVLSAAKALSYVPSETGRSLATRATRRIGLVADDLTNPFYPELVEPLRDRLEQAGYRALLVSDRVDDPVEADRLADGSLDGVVLTTTETGSTLPHELVRRGVPCVLANREAAGLSADTCVVDNQLGGAQVAGLLASLGHRRIGAVFGPASTSTGRDREAGFRAALGERGIPLPGESVRRGPFTHDAGRAAVGELLALSDPPTAVFCANDVVAMGACSAAAALGVRVPDGLTVVGFDDIAMAGWDVFGLSTVRGDLTVMADEVVRMLLARIADPERPAERVVIAPTLVLRRSHRAVGEERP